MKLKDLFLIMLLLGSLCGSAQDQSQATAGFDVGTGFKNGSWSPSVLYHEEAGPHNFKWIKAGVGLRAWGYYASDISLNSQSEKIPQDRLGYNKVSVNGLSFVAGVNFRFWRVDLGANTDLIGFVTGKQRNGLYTKSTGVPGTGANYYNKHVPTTPKVFNVVPLFQNKQTGQSEIYARLWLGKSVGVKLGYLFGRVTYVTRKVEGEKIILDNGKSSFSASYGMPYASLCFSILD